MGHSKGLVQYYSTKKYWTHMDVSSLGMAQSLVIFQLHISLSCLLFGLSFIHNWCQSCCLPLKICLPADDLGDILWWKFDASCMFWRDMYVFLDIFSFLKYLFSREIISPALVHWRMHGTVITLCSKKIFLVKGITVLEFL